MMRALLPCIALALASAAWAEPGEIVFPGVGERGIFDAALEAETGSRRIWMSYSAVEQRDVDGVAVDHIGTRLAVSEDRGETWSDQGVIVNVAQAETNLPAGLSGAAVWQHEVSRIVYDRRAPVDERWKLLWHRYLLVGDGNPLTDDRHFEYGWIGVRAAATAAALASAPERKLFSGAAYAATPAIAAYNDTLLGPPDVRLDQLDPRLADCAAFSEPGATATADGLYVSLVCGTANPATRRVVLLRWSYPGPWQYLGVMLDAAGAASLDSSYTGFSAPDLYHRGRRVFLIVSPTVAPFDFYGGCLVFRLAAFDSAALRDRDGDARPDELLAIPGDAGGFSGACAFASKARRSGLILGRALLAEPVRYHLFSTGLRP
jgi:hypothetical protein